MKMLYSRHLLFPNSRYEKNHKNSYRSYGSVTGILDNIDMYKTSNHLILKAPIMAAADDAFRCISFGFLGK